ncbi:MAG: InlB B-repeat-containing protein [Alphaproteobacteria bacterium]|nr:InlB B-repeat-containing protein [Alphaproteobacteria bacterium]
MGKIRRFLGILTIFATVFFGTNAFADGFSCPTKKKYIECNDGYYLSDCGTQLNELLENVGENITPSDPENSCITCPEGWICNAGNSCPEQRCNKITIDGNGGTVTPNVLYKKTGLNGWYKDSECTEIFLSGPADGFTINATNKVFNGLYSSKAVVGGTKLFNGNGLNSDETWLVTKDTTIYARWSECTAGYHVYNNECTANTYTVLFHSNDNSTSAATKRQSFTYGVAQELSANTFTRTGYTFQGWATSSTATTATYSDEQSVENLSTTNGATVNLYAVWKPNTYTVVFYSNTGATNSAAKRQSFTYDVAQNLSVNTFTRTGYTFQGWATSSTATNATYSDEQSVKNLSETNGAIVNLYAVWQANTYSVKFYANGGSGTMANQTFTYDAAQNLTANTFTRAGYTFKGWSPNKDATVIDFADKESVSNLISVNNGTYDLYAVWAACTAGYYCPAGSTSVTQNKCPANWTSDAGAGAQSDCKREIILDSNGLTWADTNTTAQKKVWVNYNVSYVLPTPSAFVRPDGIYPTGDWSTTKPTTIGASASPQYKSIKYTSTEEKTPTLYALRSGADVTITLSPADPYSGSTSYDITCSAYDGECTLLELPWPPVSGYNFAGWKMISNSCNDPIVSDLLNAGTIYAPGDDVSGLFICPGNADYEMEFVPVASQGEYNVTFSCGDGNGTAKLSTVTYGGKLTAPGYDQCTKEGHFISTWQEQTQGISLDPGETIEPWQYTIDDVVFVAQYEPNAVWVTYEAFPGVIDPEEQTCRYGEESESSVCTVQAPHPQTGYNFDKWLVTYAQTEYDDFVAYQTTIPAGYDLTPLAKDGDNLVTLEAQYSPKQFVIKFYCDDSKEVLATDPDPLAQPNEVTFGGELYGIESETAEYYCNKSDYHVTQWMCENYEIKPGESEKYTNDEAVDCYAVWESDFVTCPVGQYYDGNTKTCTTCTQGYYCDSETTVETNSATTTGRNSCLTNAFTALDGTEYEDLVSSIEGSKDITNCYFIVPAGRQLIGLNGEIDYMESGWYNTGGMKVHYNKESLVDKSDYAYECSADYGEFYQYSDIGSTSHAQCYGEITFNKNSGIGSLNGEDAEKNTATQKCYLSDAGHAECTLLSGASLTRTGFAFNGWGTDTTCNTKATSVKPNGSTPVSLTYYACWSANTVGCSAGYYLPAKSTSAANCKLCEKGAYCPGSNDFTLNSSVDQGLVDCATVGSADEVGTYSQSDAGAKSADECYTMVETACYDPCGGASRCTTCPENFSRCAYETTATLTVKRYSSGDNVEIGERTCPIKTGTEDNVCDTSHYFSEETNDCSNSCESLGGQCQNHDGTTGSCWNSSSKATPSKGTNACYGFGCKATCDLFNDYLIYSDGTFYDTPINHCPKNANCTDNTESNDSIQSYRWYPQTICTPSRPCTFTYTCNAGYVASTTGDITYGSYRTLNGSPTTAVTLASCDPGVFAVELNPTGGTGGTTLIWEKYTVGWFSDEAATKSLNTIQIPTRENYRFLGYFLDGTEVIDMDGIVNPGASNLFTSNGVITAQWERLQTECKVGKDADDSACQPGYYCPGGWVDAGTEYDENTGCMRLCPTDKINGNVSSAEYSDDITDCYAVRSNVELGDKTGAGDQTCYYGTSEYDARCNIKITSCVAGRYREAENSQTCALVGIGAYSVEGSIEKKLCETLDGANETTTTNVDNASTPTQCYNTCSNISIENGVRVPKQPYVYYDDSTIPACEYETKCNTGYMALGDVCYPKVLTITLDKGAEDVTQAVDTIYLKYNDGWYSKATVGANGQPDATNRIESITVPKKQNYSFGGYKALNDEVVINPDGSLSSNYTIFSENATLTAVWGENPIIKCDKGMYYDGFEDACVVCPKGAYCGGVTTHQNGDKIDKGIEYCEALNGTYVEVINQNGRPVEVSISSAKGSDEKEDCYATNVQYVSGTNRASGRQTCYYDDATNSYSVNCDDIQVMSCIAGHWLESNKDIDCTEVGYGYYSAAKSLGRVACPNLGEVDNVTTQSTTSETVTQCYLGDRWVETTNGAQRLSCYHIDDANETNVDKGYSYQCAMPVIVACNAGYYDDGQFVNENGVRDCVPVGNHHYSPEQAFFTDELEQPLSAKPGSSTLLKECPSGGRTNTTTAGRITECYKEKLSCDITNGKGENTCHYDDTKGAYALDCTTCIVTECDENFSQVGNTCIGCPADNVCSGGEQKTCSELTGGAYAYADAGTTDVARCYADCDLGENATQMSGRDYYGDNVADTCQIAACKAGFYLNNGQCVTCPAGSVCTTDEPGNTPKTCAELTGGLYTMSAPGASSIDACYKECEEYAVTNGTAVPVEDTVFYPFECEFEGRSPTGNPCDIIDNVCIETSCNYNFELIDGICTPCARENAISYKQGGNCVVESCVSGYHPNGQACESNVIECSAPNAIAATQKWDSNKNAFGECVITECAEGYHLGSNACQVDEQVCELENGIGVREWNHNTNTWGECIAIECNPGYTNDSSLTNEGWKQCGRCNNMYSANGELAASSYVRGCEIASCMYQGELYNLEDNECRLICDTYSDETGSRKWNASRKKCEHTCAPGYTTW